MQGRSGRDFELEPGTEFCYQHDVRVLSVDGDTWTISLHNNGNTEQDVGNQVTTGLVIDVHFNTSTITPNKRMWNPEAPVFAVSQGSFQSLGNGHWLAGHGATPITEEYDENGALVMNAQFGNNRVQLNYRAYRDQWVGTPKTKPAVVACADAGKTVAYVSWNGATGITDWRVRTGTSGANSTAMVVVPKNGFETWIELGAPVRSVRVEAVGGPQSGTSLDMALVNGTERNQSCSSKALMIKGMSSPSNVFLASPKSLGDKMRWNEAGKGG